MQTSLIVSKTRQSTARGVSTIMAFLAVGLAFNTSSYVLADLVSLPALDAGFVTDMGGSSKGDGTLVPSAKYNYSVGFEMHYSTGALGSPLAPTLRKNFFVFDLTGVTATITSAKLKIWTGTFESVHSSEVFELVETTEVPAAVGLAAALAAGTSPSDFDEPSDPLVTDAKVFYEKLADGPLVLGSASIDSSMDDGFVEISLTPGSLGYLNLFLGEFLILGGNVPTVTLPDGTPQQPFGFTGPDIPGGDPLTPVLMLTSVPEPACVLLCACGACSLFFVRRTRRPSSG